MAISSILTLIIGGLLFLIFLWLGIYPSLGIRRVKYNRFPYTNEESRKWLEEHIEQAKEEVLIISGSFNPYVYNPIAEAIKRKMEDNPTIQISMLAGPEILTLNGVNEIYKLAQSDNRFGGRLQIDFLCETPTQHYRVIDTTHLFVEDSHRLGETHRMAETLENSLFKSWQYKRAFLRKIREAKRVSQVRLMPIEELLKLKTEGG